MLQKNAKFLKIILKSIAQSRVWITAQAKEQGVSNGAIVDELVKSYLQNLEK